mmetsp:Transcript_41320/g.86738  ORF Transcript_41320/g.86738 Transcript_41320/m.86738 type:complete len:297 (-) Transcript_41320:540-1430(-)|eukprot:CAMPEP_0183747366 /NCGR_PEP_ID=MMETSP0737-20130205/67225_1 /TAXON_ID=385413 /ORGANISM="Thalassiosira miniscula, Strain CCMP1093" /LENGTH=296 /DNA_ID=CAMNT_0025983075 /DNA_START=690 /DNA_END=1580 /DNA_ORIENTATION=+
MQRINAEYANRVAKVLDNTIGSLKSCSDEVDDEFDSSRLVHELQTLRTEIFDTLTLTLVEDESLRSDTRKFQCERSTKNDELVKLQRKLLDMREEREERRVELEQELQDLHNVLQTKLVCMSEEREERKAKTEHELNTISKDAQVKRATLEGKRDEVRTQREAQRHSYADEEAQLRDVISSLKFDKQNLSHDHDAAMSILNTTMEMERSQLEQQKERRYALEEHFKLVDMNKAVIKKDEDQLRRVSELEEKAAALLDNGAVSLQKLWRGVKERELVAKMKSKKKKKGKKGGKKKKK